MKRTVGLRRTICNHPARPQIDLAIATGLAKRAVAERFSVSRDAVWRHAQAHLTAEMRAALATRLLQREGDTRRILLEEGAGVTEALKAIRGPLFGLFLAAVDTGDNKGRGGTLRAPARKPRARSCRVCPGSAQLRARPLAGAPPPLARAVDPSQLLPAIRQVDHDSRSRAAYLAGQPEPAAIERAVRQSHRLLEGSRAAATG